MPGSGKGVVAGVARSLGFQVVRMGDVIREEAQKRDAKIGETAIQLRKEYGEFVVAERCIQRIKDLSKTSSEQPDPSESPRERSDLYIIEGIRSPYEVVMFRENFPEFKVLSINSSPETRFNRLLNRKRADDSHVKSEFETRDKRELKFGIGEVMATADYVVINEGSIKRFKNSVRGILTNEM